jgi:hypothetical protein
MYKYDLFCLCIYLNNSMKALTLLFIALIGCSVALKTEHNQRYAPSTPGGSQTNTGGSTSNVTPLINGVPYVYKGPFTLACWLPSNTNTPYRYDTCYNSQACYKLLIDYQQCRGTVKRYAPVA